MCLMFITSLQVKTSKVSDYRLLKKKINLYSRIFMTEKKTKKRMRIQFII